MLLLDKHIDDQTRLMKREGEKTGTQTGRGKVGGEVAKSAHAMAGECGCGGEEPVELNSERDEKRHLYIFRYWSI